MFSDPQSITVNTVAQSLPATGRLADSSIYRKDDEAYELVVSHQYGSRKRFNVRVNAKKTVADPLVTGKNLPVSSSVHLTMDVPLLGFTNTEIKDIALALTAWATSANLLKVLGGET